MYRFFFKRIFDFLIAMIILILLFPLLVFVSCCLFISNDGKPFFSQSRPGLEGKEFKIIKFKTMSDKVDSRGVLLEDNLRITKIGLVIRKTSIDELPQLLNVLKGEMSLIGPRPLLPQYLSLYNDEQKKRHEVKPGITGWAQVNGRNAISWKRKFELDVYYVDNVSFNLDFKIILMTIKKVIRRDDVSQEGHVTTEPFNGYN